MNILLFRFSCFCLLLLSVSVRAQSLQTGIKGTIRDSSAHSLLAKASVFLKKKSVLLKTMVTDKAGNFAFVPLVPDTYDLEIQHQTCQKRIIKGIIVEKGWTVSSTWSLLKKPIPPSKVSESDGKTFEIVMHKSKRINSRQNWEGAYQKSGSKLEDSNEEVSRIKGNALVFEERIPSGAVDPNEEYNKIIENRFQGAILKPLSTFSIDVDRSSYANIRRMLNTGQIPPPDAVRFEEMVNYFEYEYPQPSGNEPFSVQTEYTDCPWKAGHQIVHIGIRGRKISIDNMPANNLVFLLDVSGSMNEPIKLPLVKSSLRLLVNQMRAEDKVSIVVYAGAAGLVLPPTNGTEKQKILDALEGLSAGGSTAGGQGILLAYKTAKENFLPNGNNRIILATDGDFNVGIQNQNDLQTLVEQKRKENIYLSVLGFGSGNYKDARMETLADKGNGNYAYIDNLLEAQKVLVKEMGGTLLTIAKDVKIQVEFNPSRVRSYRLLGYENRLLQDADFNDDKKDAGELGSGHTVTALYEIIPVATNEKVDSIDQLKYQEIRKNTRYSNELLTLKLRYKRPEDSTSQLITHVLTQKPKPLTESSENCRFACAVVEFGMLLRNSEYKANSAYPSVLRLAKSAKGQDAEGYRGEFIRLVTMAEGMKKGGE